jgi:hypothetical protein
MLTTRSGRRPSQREDELRSLIALFQQMNVRRYLEVGARHGDTFHEIMRNLPAFATGVAVDLGGGAWGTPNSVEPLRSACAALQRKGYGIDCLFGNSQDPGMVAAVRALGPFDAILIDGDHRYEAVKRDWLNYGPMGRLVAFHDIDGEGQASGDGLPVEVQKLWAELKPHHETTEFLGSVRGMGIGVIFR